MAKSNQKVVLITGCSTGIGLATAVVLANDAEKRFKVYATMRNLDKKDLLEKEGAEYLGKTLFIEKLDVSSEEEIGQVVDNLMSKEGRIDVLGKQPQIITIELDFRCFKLLVFLLLKKISAQNKAGTGYSSFCCNFSATLASVRSFESRFL